MHGMLDRAHTRQWTHTHGTRRYLSEQEARLDLAEGNLGQMNRYMSSLNTQILVNSAYATV